jgi:NAD-reducing hydrogenase small subunit
MTVATKIRLATIWLDGCSGCHMSLYDTDQRLTEIASLIDLVYGPLGDFKDFPEDVDVTLVEGTISNEDDLRYIQQIREHTRVLISLGDCTVGAAESRVLCEIIPRVRPASRPVHEVVPVDAYVPGCPPSPDLIFSLLGDLMAGKTPSRAGYR